MFQCFLRPRGRPHTSPVWRTFLNISDRRGIKMSKVATMTQPPNAYATVVTGRQWLEYLAKNDIGHHSESQRLTTMKDLIVVRTASRHIRKFTDDAYFTSSSGHSAAESVVRRYLRDHKEKPLWCVTTVHSGEKPIVRGKARNRFHAAYNQALKNAGYETAGRRVRESKVGGGNPAISELFGTVHIMTYSPKDILKVPFTTLGGFFEKVVQNLEHRLGRTKASQVQAQRPKHQSHPIPIRRVEAQAQQPQHRVQNTSIRRLDNSRPDSRGPRTLPQEPPRGRGDGNDHFWKLGDSSAQSKQQAPARNKKPINTGF